MKRPSHHGVDRALGRLVIDDLDDDPPNLNGPYTNPVDRFAHLPAGTRAFLEELRESDIKELRAALGFHLPPVTRAFLEELRENDIKEIRAALEFQRSVKTIGRFGRWSVVTAFVIFTSVFAAGDKIAITWRWLTGGAR